MTGRPPPAEQARFRNGKVQVQGGLAEERRADGKVECLGMLFDSEGERRAYFLDDLREKLQDPEFRKTPGFPKGEDEAILRLSDPPYYTACPNPFLDDLLQSIPQDPTSQNHVMAPYPLDITKSRNNKYVNAHSYATKVPPEIVLHYILYYTKPGEVIYDGYCGTGMTAVAAQLAERPTETIRSTVSNDFRQAGLPAPEWGPRPVIVGDLSPAASFIASNLTGRDDLIQFTDEANAILAAVEGECGWMYKTRHSDGKLVDIDVTLWSDVFLCPGCSEEMVFWDVAVDQEKWNLRSAMVCPHCEAEITKLKLSHAFSTVKDSITGELRQAPKQVPVLIVYSLSGKKFEKRPDASDLDLLSRVEREAIPWFFPAIPMMHRGDSWGDTWRSGVHAGITHTHHLFTHRNLRSLAFAWSLAKTNRAKFMLTALTYKSSILCSPLLSNYFAEKKGHSRGGWVGKERSGTLYRPSIMSEVPIHSQIRTRTKSVAVRARANSFLAIQTRSAIDSGLPSESVDYIFIDPPFGANRYYAELNFLWESWLGVFTDVREEAVVSRAYNKTLRDYQRMMAAGFAECYRILKPGNWMTVEFSNTSANVWNAIQLAVTSAGFIVADVRSLKKGQGSINAYTTPTAVQQDLVISVYKPPEGLDRPRKELEELGEPVVWNFVREHLEKLPVAVEQKGALEAVPERQARTIFNRLIGFLVQRGVRVPISAPEFQEGLSTRYPEREGMFFLPEQVAVYDRKRRTVKGLVQQRLLVRDEAGAIDWLRQQLSQKPQTYQELNPAFMKECTTWEEHEQLIELSKLLQQNFVRYEGDGEMPASIHAFLSSNNHEQRNLPKDDPRLREEAKGRWYVPEPRKAGDLEKIRERELLKEFATITSAKGRVKQLRTEAARVGFKTLWEQGDYKSIVDVASKLPRKVVEEDPHLLMYVDLARSRLD